MLPILDSAGFTGSYSGHSFHIRPATTAASHGVMATLIETIGCWSSETYQTYIQTPVSAVVQVPHQFNTVAGMVTLVLGLGASGLGVWALAVQPQASLF